ncbi:uncharacterized protein LOC123540387 [Mercenaria mercenaria]|uniref:uncharacterized protein LOC123540387 n=1 Tax=Mercenaria mercenaria TaxID=6596 RepID=UPI00234E9C2A|nr:uncharacterized protein LOC123540387 [Mercenaria mercenaria]
MLSPSRTSPRKKTACTPNVRSSPMNPVRSSPLAESSQSSDMVKLVTNKELSISVDRQGLRRACQEATIKKDNAGYILMYKMLDLVFSLEELAESRGLGIGKPRPGEEHKPVLDAGKIAVLKEYVHFWTKKNLATTFSEKRLNKAITERSHYARNQVKRQLDKSKI